MSKTTWMKKAAAMSIVPIAAFGIVGCDSTSGTEEGTDVEDVVEEDDAAAAAGAYDGVYDQTFYDEMDTYVGEEVTVSADVNEILTPMSFTIAGTDDTTVEALLVVHDTELPEVTSGLTVGVTGTVQEAFDLPTVEEEMGVDLDDEAYEDWDGEPYIEATNVDTSLDADS
ncbi:hypothetical protein [Arthrobacter roseus]|uniref:hypothetical protein n=1 Tax=Arthrobacter roseus TaxID=136274 RepID=UPI0019635464|nr:hypothetical protein [Arthrobacter roseus]MBM7846877.1 hypothetical protein [Arthrobacter roseus]